MENKNNRVSKSTLICEIAIMAAAGFILDELAGAIFKGVFVNGGSIGIAMIAVALMCYRRGPIAGLAVGFIIGLLDLATGPYMIAASPWKVVIQVLLDYVLAYPAVAFCSVARPFFVRADKRNRRIGFLCLGIAIGGTAKWLCHFLSGILFWADPSTFAWDLSWMNPYLYCFFYNAAFVLPSTLLSMGVMVSMLIKAPQLYLVEALPKEEVYRRELGPVEFALIWAAGLLFSGICVYALFHYIESFTYSDYGEYGSEISLPRDYLAAWIIALLGAFLSAFFMVRGYRGKYRPRFYAYALMFLGICLLSFGAAMVIRYAIKGKDYLPYFGWIASGVIVSLPGVLIAGLRK